MKRKERYKVLNYAKKQYSDIFCLDLQFKYISKKRLLELLKKYKQPYMCLWSYCCEGLYHNCWQDPVEEGVWDYTQEDVNGIIKYEIESTAKHCRRDSRILYCETENRIHVIIVMRDVKKYDYLIGFTDEQYA